MAILSFLESIGRGLLRLRGVSSHFVNTPQGRLHLLKTSGNGPLAPLVLLHGISSNGVPFGPTMLRLKSQFSQIIAPDHLGHGISEEPESADPELLIAALLDWIDKEIRQPVFLLGNSLGGAVALKIAVARPEKIKGLILVSPAGAPLQEADLQAFVKRFDMSEDLEKATNFIRSIYYKPPFYLPIAARIVQGVFRRPWLKRFLFAIRPHHFMTVDQVSHLPMPILFIWGRSDRLMLAEMREWFRQYLPAKAIFLEPEDFSHCPHVDSHPALSAQILDFARNVP